mgnify:CR=1 FL=1
MKKKQAWKVMGAVLAGTLVFSDAVPLLSLIHISEPTRPY